MRRIKIETLNVAVIAILEGKLGQTGILLLHKPIKQIFIEIRKKFIGFRVACAQFRFVVS